jgi:hypothetical protein
MRFWSSVSLALLLGTPALAQAQASTKSPPKLRRMNELTLAGLRPGRDKVARAIQLYGKPDLPSHDKRSLSWAFHRPNATYFLNLDLDKSDVVQFIRVTHDDGPSELFLPKHAEFSIGAWSSGRGLVVDAKTARVTQIYGEPDSRSPSTQANRKLELLYYAFDWAGTNVPQVMEVLCTVEDDGKPGRVVEITLAAPSL